MTYYDLIHLASNNENLEEEAIKFIITEYNNINNLPLHLYDDANDATIKLVNEYIAGSAPQYLIGYTYFYNLKINVNSNVLIPRFDTEIVVDECLTQLKRFTNPTVLDGFTGSGAIALSIKANSNATVSAFDVSEKALDVAKENASNLGLDVNFIHSDKFTNINNKYDLLVCNPPYIDAWDKEVDKRVFDNEPHLALFALDEGLYFYKYIIDNYHLVLNKGGIIVLEIPYNKTDKLLSYAKDKNLKAEVKKDLAGRDRVMVLEEK